MVSFVLAALLLSAQPHSGVYELQLGMHRTAVERLIGASVIERQADRSSQSDETWEGEGYSLFFCKNYLTGMGIEIGDSVIDWSRAVEKETRDRGAGTLKVESRIWGGAEMAWRLRAGGGKFTVSMTEFNEDTIKVMRWYSAEKACPAS